MSDSDNIRYIANIRVEKVSRPKTQRPDTFHVNATPRREIEAFQITVRADDFEKLKAKLSAHLELVDDDDFGDDRVTRESKEATRGGR